MRFTIHSNSDCFNDFLIIEASFQECYQCNSNDDPNCAKLTDLTKLKKKICPNYHDNECVTWIEESEVLTYRDCEILSNNALGCTCKTNLCNNEDCPKNRLKCHQCDGFDCVTLSANAQKVTCQNYDPTDQCFTVVDDSLDPVKAFRGCISDRETEGISKCLSPELNKFCITEGDNKQPGISDDFSCVQCRTDSISDDDSCAYNTELTSCGNIPLGRPIGCFTVMDGDHLIRDCYYGDKVKECDDDITNCRKCKESGCNKEPFRALSCRKCNSNDIGCHDKLGKETEFGFCLAEKYSDEELACYRLETDGGMATTRGCLNMIKDDVDKSECKKNTNNCKICTHGQCNDKSK